MKKIVVFGATGMAGSRNLREALDRGHEVTAVVRDPNGTKEQEHPRVAVGNVLSASDVARLSEGQDALISAFGPGIGNPELLVDAAHALVEGLKNKPTRLIAVGGAGSLEVAPAMHLMDTPQFPQAGRGLALARREALEMLRNSSGVNWTSVSPAAVFEPGERTASFRIGGDQLLVDEKGESRISAEDLAIAILDEVEHPRFEGKRFTAGY